MTIARVEIDRNVNAWKHGLVTVIFDDDRVEKFYIGRDTSDKQAYELLRVLKFEKKLGVSNFAAKRRKRHGI